MRNETITLLALTFIMGLVLTSTAQTRLTERKVIGEWQLIIDIDQAEIEEELEDENYLARKFAEAVTDFAFDILDDIQIIMIFEEDGDLKIEVDAYGDTEVEYGEWYINRDGELIIDNDDDEVWLMEDGYLVGYERQPRGLERKNVYLKRI